MQWYIRLQPHGQTRDRKMIVKHPHLSAQQSKVGDGCLEFVVGYYKLKYSDLKNIFLLISRAPPCGRDAISLYLRDTGSDSTV